LLLLSCTTLLVIAQQTEVKNYSTSTKAGEANLLYSYGEFTTSYSTKYFVVAIKNSGYYYLSALVNMQYGEKNKINVDGITVGSFDVLENGWQRLGKNIPVVYLANGKHEIKISNNGIMVPMVEEIQLTSKPMFKEANTKDATDAFISKMRELEAAPKLKKLNNTSEDITAKVLPNPLGEYNHAIDTSFSYSHFSWIYLTAGYHTFTTSGSTIDRALTIFNTSNFTYSWSNVNGGVGGESSLALYVALTGYYAIMLRPVTDGATGTTNIIYNGTTLVANATIGGRRIAMSTLKGGPLNFFTCKLGTGGDTRMIASRHAFSSARGYNDDYYGGGGDWTWGAASRIKKDFSGMDSVQYGYVCAYSPTSTAVCDIYLGAKNSDVNSMNYPEFPILKQDDAIMAAPSTGSYNCIAWSGGVTTQWHWPPSAYSTYNCASGGADITCFDNYYSNNPVRYPGAWNYTRTGATAANAIVDVWALNTYYTHASVRKPGNNNPHGYDWESKPGSTSRTFHPRNALTNLARGYGAVVNYYIPTGTYARTATSNIVSFETDAAAVKAGVAVFENAALTTGAQEKLSKLIDNVDPSFARTFNKLYTIWEKTKAANSIYSDPAMYCKNEEYKALATACEKNIPAAIILMMDKFVTQGDHIIGELFWTITKEQYGYLLSQVKKERTAQPNDKQGRYKIHGDHDNGVLYVEKILALLAITPLEISLVEDVKITVSPNPIQDKFTIQLTTTKAAKISITITSAQTQQKKIVLRESSLPKGNYSFKETLQGFAGNTGDIITVQVMVDGVLKTVKAIVSK
jgi:hypothetical protein